MPARGTLLDAARMGNFKRDHGLPPWKWSSNPARKDEKYSQQDKVLNTAEQQIKEVLFGGAPGGGKTHVLIALAYLHVLEFGKDAVVGMFRMETPEFRDILRQATEMYVPLGGHWNDRDRIWRFPNAGTIQMTYLRDMKDALGHKGAAYSLLLWDEITGWHDDGPYEFVMTRLRSTNPDIFCQSIGSANPDGPGMWWVRDRWRIMDPTTPPETPFLADLDDDAPADMEPHKRVFIPSLLQDNPHLNKDDQYRSGLYAIRDPVRRKAYINGDWSVFVGQAYPEYDENLHLVNDFALPQGWPRWAGMDWGTAKPYCLLYLALDPVTQHIYVVRETYGTDARRKNVGLGLSAAKVAKEEWTLRGQIFNPQILAVDSSIYNRIGAERTIGQDWEEAGWVCERGNRDRRTRGEKIRDVLQTILPTGRPMLQICRSCVNLIRTLPLLVMDETKPEEIKDGGEDHPWDTLGYALLCSIAVAMQGMLMQAALGGLNAGPDPRNEHYDPNTHWNQSAGQQRDSGLEQFHQGMIGRLSGRQGNN